jgi:heat shock protein HtpX
MGFWFGLGGDSRDRDRGGGILMLLLAPFAAMLIQLWVSRTREYEADATGAGITHNPYALARALQKLDAYSKRVPMIASPSTAHLFIIQPLTAASILAETPPEQRRRSYC